MTRTALGTGLLWIIGIVTVAAIIAGIWVIDSPNQQRRLRLDDARVSDLVVLETAARSYWKEHDRLPPSLDVLRAQPGVNLPARDPDGGPDYRYRLLDATHFELCARFATDTAARTPEPRGMPAAQWAHPAGEHCFRRSAKDSG